MEPFKNIFNKRSSKVLLTQLQLNSKKSLPLKEMQKEINREIENLEMKDRTKLIARILKEHLNLNYKQTVNLFIKSLADETVEDGSDQSTGINGFMCWPLLEYIAEYGLEDFESSFKSMYEMTKRFTAEFAIRPFLQLDDKRVFQIIEKWKNDKNHHVRRLCSEGTRPNLPWGLKVPQINKNLKRNIKLLNHLKDDPEEYVRRSVANHLNDISHHDKDLMLKTAKAWNIKNISKERSWVIRHASRTLLKKGHPEALLLHGYDPNPKSKLSLFTIDKKQIKEGESFQLNFSVKNQGKQEENVLIEYVIHYLKKDGTHSKRPFRLRDFKIQAGEKKLINKKIHFKRVTTRKHYPGEHKISIQINGRETDSQTFKLKI